MIEVNIFLRPEKPFLETGKSLSSILNQVLFLQKYIQSTL